ncbi:hypothetical protein TNCV_537061 [Trichonephila clavipes]|nr:hypothetical protein TNCV_537061 [Trichonephila clavipes]
MAFNDGPRNSVPWSSYENDTFNGTPCPREDTQSRQQIHLPERILFLSIKAKKIKEKLPNVLKCSERSSPISGKNISSETRTNIHNQARCLPSLAATNLVTNPPFFSLEEGVFPSKNSENGSRRLASVPVSFPKFRMSLLNVA